jgi:ribosome biogenesis GTPase A
LLESRYGVPQSDAHGWLQAAADRHTSGDTARMAQRFLDDFRRGMLGPLALELP